MGIWVFVLTETRHGQGDHMNHLHRRDVAWARAGFITPPIKPVTNHDGRGDVHEWESPPGVFNYFWKVNDPSDGNVFALVSAFEAQNPQSVYCSASPIRLRTPAEQAALQDLSVKLRDFDDSGIK